MANSLQQYAARHNNHFSGVAAGEKHAVFSRDYFALHPVLVSTAVDLTENWIDNTRPVKNPVSWFERWIHPKPAPEVDRKDILRKITAYFLSVLESHGKPEAVGMMNKLLDYVRWVPGGRDVWSVFCQFYTQASVMSVLYLNAQPGPGELTQREDNALTTVLGMLPNKVRVQVKSACARRASGCPWVKSQLAYTSPGLDDNLAVWEEEIRKLEKC